MWREVLWDVEHFLIISSAFHFRTWSVTLPVCLDNRKEEKGCQHQHRAEKNEQEYHLNLQEVLIVSCPCWLQAYLGWVCKTGQPAQLATARHLHFALALSSKWVMKKVLDNLNFISGKNKQEHQSWIVSCPCWLFLGCCCRTAGLQDCRTAQSAKLVTMHCIHITQSLVWFLASGQ